MSEKDPVDDLLGNLKPVEPPTDARPLAERAFLNHAEQSKQTAAPAWRAWGRWIEPVGAGLFVLIFLIWAFRMVFGG
jgi:hypothetical protein